MTTRKIFEPRRRYSTVRDVDVLRFLSTGQSRLPSFDKTSSHFGWSSTNAAAYRFSRLQKRGWIKKEERAYVLTFDGHLALSNERD